MDTGRMDTKTFQAEFRGRSMELKRLTDGQLGILISLRGADDKTAAGNVRHVMMIIESRMSSDDWTWMQDQIAMGDVGLQDLVAILAGPDDSETPDAPAMPDLSEDAEEIAMAEAALAKLRARAAAK